MPGKNITQVRYHIKKEVKNKLSKNLRIVVVLQDKDRGIVIMGKDKYTENV